MAFPFEQAPPLRTITVPYGSRIVKCLPGPLMLPVSVAPKAPEEQVLITFDFTKVLPVGVTIRAAIVTSTLFSGVDPDSGASMPVGVAAISSDGTMVSCQIQGGVLGCVYGVQALTNCSDGEYLAAVAQLSVQAIAAQIFPTILTDDSGNWLVDNYGDALTA